MELVQHRIVVPTHHSTFSLFFLGDTHFGTHACDKGTLQRDIEKIRQTPNSRVIGMGDYSECIIPSDRRRWRMGELDPELFDYIEQNKTEDVIKWQKQQVIKYFRPLKGRILGLLQGDHEEALMRDTNRDIVPSLAEQLDAKYYRSSAYIRLSITCERTNNAKVLFIKVFHPKASGSATPAPKLNRLMRHLEYWNADIVVIGGTHTLISTKLPGMRLSLGKLKLVQRVRVVGASGSYYRAYGPGSTYAERADLPPSLLGCLCVTYKIDGDELDVHG